MRRVLMVVLCGLGLVAPGRALAVGGPIPPVVGGAGVTETSGPFKFIALASGNGTLVERVRRDGARVDGRRLLRGQFGVPGAALDGTTTGLSADGRTLVLADSSNLPPNRTHARCARRRPAAHAGADRAAGLLHGRCDLPDGTLAVPDSLQVPVEPHLLTPYAPTTLRIGDCWRSRSWTRASPMKRCRECRSRERSALTDAGPTRCTAAVTAHRSSMPWTRSIARPSASICRRSPARTCRAPDSRSDRARHCGSRATACHSRS